jgi:hypothetical protein
MFYFFEDKTFSEYHSFYTIAKYEVSPQNDSA